VTAVLGSAALAVVAAAILAGAVVLGRTRSLRQALPVLLDLLTAAGLLRLSVAPNWNALIVTAVVIALRRLTTAGIRTAFQVRRTS
jgi:hypothetical protein